MTRTWSVTTEFLTFFAELVKSSAFAAQMNDYYPWIGWTLGTAVSRAGQVVSELPARYGVGVTKKNNIAPDQVRIPVKGYGLPIFSPSPEDVSSSRRTLDYDGSNIVVR